MSTPQFQFSRLNAPTKLTRVSLPAALGIIGIALSCSTACVTSALIDSANEAAAHRRAAAALAGEEATVAQALRRHLPPAAATTPETDRLHVSGSAQILQVEATGDFSPPAVAELSTAARQLYGPIIPFDTALELTLYRDTGGTRMLLDRLEINPSKEAADQLRRQLPAPASAKTTESQRFDFFTSGDSQTCYISAVGDFTPETARAFIDFARQLQASLPGTPRFILQLYHDSDTGAHYLRVGHFDSMQPDNRTP